MRDTNTSDKRQVTIWPGMLVLIALFTSQAHAYPEFQQYVQENSGRNVDCAMCHAHSDGPSGLKPGQIGSLSPIELEELSHARAAFDPGQEIDSPILNEFGNHIMFVLGKTQFLELRMHPEDLAEAIGDESDLDEDGIPDATEYLHGTHALNSDSGDPWLLFKHNLKQHRLDVLMIFLATLFGIFGLTNLLHWFDTRSRLSRARRKELMERSGDSGLTP